MTERIGDYRKPIACIACGQSQQPTILWLTCEYCGIVLEEHPHFEKEKNLGDNQSLGSIAFSLDSSCLFCEHE